jgi:mitochondrial intermediate peptidase
VLYARLDQALYGVPDPMNPSSTEIFANLHRQSGVPYVDGTHWHSRFGHLVTYGAGYYGYLYAQVFARDLWSQLFEGRSLERDSGDRLWHGLLQHGGAKDPAAMLTDLLGRPPRVDNFANIKPIS